MRNSDATIESSRSLNPLRVPGLLFIGSWMVHTADHARRGLGATTEAVVWGGTFVGILAAVALTLIFVGHATAPAVAAAVFPAIAVGVCATHLLPGWGVLSDPILIESTTDGWSIVAVFGEIAAAGYLGAVALQLIRAHSFAWNIPISRWS